ncbi:MAG: hypothetical protein M3Z04_18145 [Chloroflexota bacterium]|nr:hypothetical protein [Chloroflexota bacterium]
MNLLFQSTKQYEEDLRRFSPSDRDTIIAKLNHRCSLLLTHKGRFREYAYKPHIFRLEGGLDSSLQVLRINPQIRVILTIDEDPIFDQIIITLWRMVQHDDLTKAFNGIAQSLYQQSIVGIIEKTDETNGADQSSNRRVRSHS